MKEQTAPLVPAGGRPVSLGYLVRQGFLLSKQHNEGAAVGTHGYTRVWIPTDRRPRRPVQKDPLVSVAFSEQQGGGVKASGVGSVR